MWKTDVFKGGAKMGALYFLSSTKYSVVERQTKRGKVYDCRFRLTTIDGKSVNKCLSGYSSKTALKEAYTDFVTKNCELLKNRPSHKKEQQAVVCDKVRDILPIYFQTMHNQTRDATIYEKIKLFDLKITPKWGDYRLKEITESELRIWQDELWSSINPKDGKHYAYKYLSKIRTYFSAFLSWCVPRYGIVNYLPKIQKPRRITAPAEMSIWTRDDFDKFIAVVDDPTYKMLFTMLFFTGRRKGEVLALSSDDIKETAIKFTKSITRKTLSGEPYEITSAKTNKLCTTPICAPLKKALAEYIPPQGQFFFGGNSPLTDNTLRRAFNRYAALAGVKQIRIHDLRHSFVSMCIHLGANLTVIADLIGDTLTQVTKTYAHLYEEDKLKIIAQIK